MVAPGHERQRRAAEALPPRVAAEPQHLIAPALKAVQHLLQPQLRWRRDEPRRPLGPALQLGDAQLLRPMRNQGQRCPKGAWNGDFGTDTLRIERTPGKRRSTASLSRLAAPRPPSATTKLTPMSAQTRNVAPTAPGSGDGRTTTSWGAFSSKLSQVSLKSSRK